MWVCISIRPGSTVWSDKSTTLAPDGAFTEEEGPISEILSPTTTIETELIVVPSPTITVPALISVVWLDCANT